MPEAIPLPGLTRLWKVRYVDSMGAPQITQGVLVRGQTVLEVATRAKKTKEFQAFVERFPEADVVLVEFMGDISG